MSTLLRPASLAAVLLIVTACTGSAAGPGASGTPPPSGAPSDAPASAPSESPDFGEIEHATGATDVILRYDEGGGFVPMGFAATQAPIFTLYGDGTVIFRNPNLQEPGSGSIISFPQFRTAHLSEEQIQATLAMAIGEGGLGTGRPKYDYDLVADASTAEFMLNAGGLRKTVSVYALGIDLQNGSDALARAAFLKLAERLADFDQGGTIKTDPYEPERYRGVLTEGQPGDPAAIEWPWDDLGPADFKAPADPNSFGFPSTVLTVDQVKALDIEQYQGGFFGVTLIGPDKKLYSFAVRPLLPDDRA